tara:strand:- start:167 stop:496 length:330 start_codon:yes stop_codon:yes gene_type:complete
MNKELINKKVETELNEFGMRKYQQGTFLISYFMYGGIKVDGKFVSGSPLIDYPRFADGHRTYDYTHSKECLEIAKRNGHTHYELRKQIYIDPVMGGWLYMNETIQGEFV